MMTRIISIALLLLVQTSFGQKSMTLQECIDYGLENNPNIKNAREAIKAAEGRVGEYISSGLPQISASADLGNNYLIPTTFVPAQIFDPNAPEGELAPVKFGTQYTGRASIDLNQMIFSGSYFVGLKASKTYTELSRKDLVQTEVDLLVAVKKAYYSVLVNQERHTLVEKNFQRLDSLLRQTRAMHENGFAEKIDVNRVQVQFNNISQAIKSSSTAVEVTLKLLKFQMGMPMADSITLADNLQTIQFQVLNEDFSAFNYVDRIEYNILEVNSALAELDIKNTKVQYLPTMDFYGNYGASYGTSVFSNFVAFGDNWKTLGSYGIRLNLPIFDGLRKSKQIQQKKSRLNQIEFTKTLVKNQIDMEQEQATLLFANNLDALKIQQENMKLSEEVYLVALIKYQQGVGSSIELMNADADYKEAQINYFSALYDALISTVDLEKAYGKLAKSSN
jgi:outer membrane protein TolC